MGLDWRCGSQHFRRTQCSVQYQNTSGSPLIILAEFAHFCGIFRINIKDAKIAKIECGGGLTWCDTRCDTVSPPPHSIFAIFAFLRFFLKRKFCNYVQPFLGWGPPSYGIASWRTRRFVKGLRHTPRLLMWHMFRRPAVPMRRFIIYARLLRSIWGILFCSRPRKFRSPLSLGLTV